MLNFVLMMRVNIYDKYYVLLVLSLCCLIDISGYSENDSVINQKKAVNIPVIIKEYEFAPKYFPVHICAIYPWGLHGQQSKNHIYNFSLSILAGKVRGINGLQISGLYSQAPEKFNGLQVAGIGGNSAGNMKGIQIGGVTNYSVNMKGVQIAGLVNAAAANAVGIQISGFTNASANIKGIQISGVGSAAHNMTGIQIGGISTLAQNMTGLQISGTYNRIDTLKGVSISVASFADTIAKGFSLSFVNIVKQGYYREWELSFADYANVAISYRMGTKKLYTIYTTGINFIDDNQLINGIGFGNRTPIGKRFDFQPELGVQSFLPTNLISLKNIKNIFEARFKLGFVYRLNEKFGLSLAPSVYVKNDNKQITKGLGVSLGLKMIKK